MSGKLNGANLDCRREAHGPFAIDHRVAPGIRKAKKAQPSLWVRPRKCHPVTDYVFDKNTIHGFSRGRTRPRNVEDILIAM